MTIPQDCQDDNLRSRSPRKRLDPPSAASDDDDDHDARPSSAPARPGPSQPDLREKKDVIEALSRFRVRIHMLERELDTVTSRASVRSEFAELMEDELATHEIHPSREQKDLADRIRRMRETVRNMASHSKERRGTANFIPVLKQLMESIETGIIVFKEDQRDRYEQLLQDEKRLSQEVATMDDRIGAWEKQGSVEPAVEIPRSGETAGRDRASSDGTLLAEDYLVKHGGHYGGWDDLTHNAFVKLRQKYGANDTRFMQACISNLPCVTLETASAHEKWFRGYRKLLEAKKAAIAKWKQEKEARDIPLPDVSLPPALFVTDLVPHLVAMSKTSAMLEKEIVMQKKVKETVSERERAKRETRKMDIEKWKAERKLREVHIAQEINGERAKEREAATKRREQNERKKSTVLEYVQKRAEEQAQQRQVEEELQRVRKRMVQGHAQEELKRLAEKDAELIQKKREAVESKAREQEEKRRRLDKLRSQVEVNVERDPSRVLRSTAGFQARIESPRRDEFEAAQSGFRPNFMPKRQIPGWRKGI
ncbi:hypothetical protein BDK51DRAFT_27899 [Blyttiomyces helicus]|uniref:Coiled-coil domain-containing protein 112 n=1 Tax=Blyttiomyces helicus TaxID=388810 RepID=A0A4P9WFW3_9FUNG|nr:hypothetical protein BDK51DRAFT_27899 [Blyttiomyces helicus]|eukprot:RKO91554.1 hypothetical protein BDK51DRAFT_27899 [Blyttiomyces helicus]